MATAPSAAFVALLRQHRLLEPGQQKEVEQTLSDRFAEPKDLARELVQRGWLTPYQANQLLQGQGQELLLGSYVLLGRLGEGGMGQVFKARHRGLDRLVALKLIRKERLAHPDAIRRFHREIRAAAQLNHPNVVLAFDADQFGGTHFFTMEYVPGTDLSKFVKESGRLPIEQACNYVRQAARGLQHAFERGLIHRDIKPANLLLTATGGVVKILDMGLARVQRSAGAEDSSSLLTQEGSVMGSLDYIAPEQALDSHTVDIRADLYSLGCTFYFLLTGQVPFPGGEALAKLAKHQSQEPVPVEQLRPKVPPGVVAIVRRLMAKRPEDRYQTPAELVTALAPFTSQVDPAGERTSTGSPAGVTPFARLEAADATGIVAAAIPVQSVVPPKRRWRQPIRWATGVGLLGLVGLLLAQLLFKSTDQSGKVPAIEGAKDSPVQGLSPLDRLDPARLPVAERFAWQPKELVAVLGEHRQRHWSSPYAVAVRPDGKQAASGGRTDGLIRFWDLATQCELAVLENGTAVESLAYSADGKRLAASATHHVRIWDLSGPKPILQATINQPYDLLSLAFASDGQTLVVTSERFRPPSPPEVWLWDLTVAPPKVRVKYPGCTLPTFSPDGKTLAVVRLEDQSMRLYDLRDALPKERAGPPGHYQAAGFAPDGRLATIDPKRTLQLWDLTGQEPRLLVAVQQAHTRMVFAADGKRLATVDPLGFELEVWGLEGAKLVPKASLNIGGRRNSGVRAVAVTPNGQTLITAHNSGAVRFWDVAGAIVREKSALAPQSTWYPFVLLPDGRTLVTTGEDERCHLWDLSGPVPQELAVPADFAGGASPLALSADGTTLVTWNSKNGHMRLWRVQGRGMKELLTLLPRTSVSAAAFSPDGGSLALGCGGKISLWSVSGAVPQERWSIGGQGNVEQVAFTPDGRTLVSCADDKMLRLWHVTKTGLAERAQIAVDLLKALAISPDGKTLVLGTWRSEVQFWDLGEGEPVKRLTVSAGCYVTSLAFAPDGRSLVSAGTHKPRGPVRLWDVATGRQLCEWTFPGNVHRVVYTPDGRHLITANGNGTIYVLRLAPAPASGAP